MEKIKNYLLDNEGELVNIVEELNCNYGTFESLRPYVNDEYTINELFENDAYNFMERCSYGSYNIHDEYFTFDGLGHIYSCDWETIVYDMKLYIDEIVEELLYVYTEIYVSDNLLKLIEEYKKIEEEEEEEE